MDTIVIHNQDPVPHTFKSQKVSAVDIFILTVVIAGVMSVAYLLLAYLVDENNREQDAKNRAYVEEAKANGWVPSK